MTSFIIPAHNEELELAATLDAICAAASHAAQRYEIIVIDDASTDGTAEIASRAAARVIRINRRQIAASRNAGGRAAQGEYLFFVDADTRINRVHVTQGLAVGSILGPALFFSPRGAISRRLAVSMSNISLGKRFILASR